MWLDRLEIVGESKPLAALPPGVDNGGSSKLPEGFHRVTPDGWEIAILNDGQLLSAVHRGRNQSFRRRLKRGQIDDVVSDGDGGVIAAVRVGGFVGIYRLSERGRIISFCTQFPSKEYTRIAAASRSLVVFQVRELGVNGGFVDLDTRRYGGVKNLGRIRTIPLPNGRALVLRLSLTDSRCRWRKGGANQFQPREPNVDREVAYLNYRYFERKRAQLDAINGRARAGATWNYYAARVYLHSSGGRPLFVRKRDICLSVDTVLYDQAEQGEDYLLRVASIVESYTLDREGNWLAIERQTLRLTKDDLYVVSRDKPTPIGNDLACWTHFAGHIVLAFESGRIEIRNLSEPEPAVALAYVIGRPDSMIVSECRSKHYLAVAAGEMTWFDVTDFAVL